MVGGTASVTGLDETLARCQPTRVELSHNHKQLGAVDVLITPKDMARRSSGDAARSSGVR